jgi:hypothetical protein
VKTNFDTAPLAAMQAHPEHVFWLIVDPDGREHCCQTLEAALLLCDATPPWSVWRGDHQWSEP